MLERLRWPLPALLAWGAAWALFATLQWCGVQVLLALALACLAGVGASALGQGWWRRLLIALGFPLSLAVSGAVTLPGWAWLVPLGLLLLVYPLNAWRDAPLFPTPARALQGLAVLAPLPHHARVLDAGCGLGHGLKALRQVYPAAQLHGLEWSWPLRALCALRCPWARIRQGDIWRADWSPYAMVYLFQRPESMQRAVDKARRELQAGAWLVSLEFEAASIRPQATLRCPDGRTVWLYRAPLQSVTAKNAG